MNPPIVYEVTKPSAQRTSNTTATVHSIFLHLPPSRPVSYKDSLPKHRSPIFQGMYINWPFPPTLDIGIRPKREPRFVRFADRCLSYGLPRLLHRERLRGILERIS